MHVEFEFTHDDYVDAQRRFSARWSLVRSYQWKGMLYTASWSGLLVFLFFYATPGKGAILAFVAALLGALLYKSSSRGNFEKRMRLFSREILGDASSFLCEVELRPKGVWVRQSSCQVLHEWPSVEEVKETPDSVDIFTKHRSGVIVRNRAFASPQERLRFIELARTGVNSAQNQISNSPLADVEPN